MKLEQLNSEIHSLAMSYRPFIHLIGTDKDVNKVIESLEKSIHKVVDCAIDAAQSNREEIITRVKQVLSSIDYAKLTDFQAKCVLLLEQSIK